MVTKEQAATTSVFYHVSIKNADGSAARCRANGRLKTWVTRPDDWQLPVKHGLRECFYLSPRNAADWTTVEPVNAKTKAKARKALAATVGLSETAPDYMLMDAAMERDISEDAISDAI